jgi:hypothetical protein
MFWIKINWKKSFLIIIKKSLTEWVVMLVSRNILLSWLFPLSQHKKVIQYLLSWLCIWTVHLWHILRCLILIVFEHWKKLCSVSHRETRASPSIYSISCASFCSLHFPSFPCGSAFFMHWKKCNISFSTPYKY